MTDISVSSVSYQVEKRDWLLSAHGTDMTPSATLDISLFTQATHYPDGFIRSGQAVGKVTATGLYGPYDGAASDGRQTAAGLLFSSVAAVDNRTGAAKAKVGGAILIHGHVDPAKLPVALDAAGQTDLAHIVFAA